MRNLVLMSPSLPFVLQNESLVFLENSKNEDTIFEVEIIQNNTFYRYGFSIRDFEIREEWLYRRKERLISVFKRQSDKDGGIRRDQIYFTSKNKYGESGLTSLSDYRNVRKNSLFSKKYLAGFYTALPDMKND